jgi:hypothetical protein
MTHFECVGVPDLSLQGYDASEFRGLGIEVYKQEDTDALIERLIERIAVLTAAVDRERNLREQIADELRQRRTSDGEADGR